MSELAKPIALWTNVILAVYALVVGLYKPELADSVSTEMILGIASAVNASYLAFQKLSAPDEAS